MTTGTDAGGDNVTENQGGTLGATLTEDRDRAKEDLDEYGYCLIANALTPTEVAQLRQRLEDQAEQEVDEGIAWIDTGGANQRVFNLLNKGSEFVDLAQHPVTMEFMGHVLCSPEQRSSLGPIELGDHFLLSSLIANITGPGNPDQPLFIHADQLPMPTPWTYAAVANVMYMLSDFTEESGATRVVPGSHKLGTNPPVDGVPETIAAVAPAGTAMPFDGRLWHGTGVNRTRSERRFGVLEYCCRPFVRQQQNHFLTIDPDVLASATPTLRRMLGYEHYAGLGAIGDNPEQFRDPTAKPLWRSLAPAQ